jgi:hypothetical protein
VTDDRNEYRDDETRAGARPSWPIESGDPDAAELREAWSALEQALGPTAEPLDDVTTARLVRQVLRREERRRRRRVGLLALAAAAVVLFLVGKPRLPQGDEPQVAQHVEQPTAPAAATPPAWDDPWDQELAAVQEQVRAVELDWSRSDDSFAVFGERLQALEAEWSRSPL